MGRHAWADWHFPVRVPQDLAARVAASGEWEADPSGWRGVVAEDLVVGSTVAAWEVSTAEVAWEDPTAAGWLPGAITKPRT